MYSKFWVFFSAAVLFVPVAFCGDEANTSQNNDRLEPEFQPLSVPDRKIGGAYYGVGLSLSNISHKLKIDKHDGSSKLSHKESVNQFDVSLIGGFGTTFYDKYYAGIELDLFKRLPEKKKYFRESGIVYKSNIGLNMDVRFGYQFPKHGTLAYLTAGFARVLGNMDGYNNNSRVARMSFGSFFPTAGVGVEHRISQTVNLRGDLRFTFGSQEKKSATINGRNWTFGAKPNRYAFRISVTRNF